MLYIHNQDSMLVAVVDYVVCIGEDDSVVLEVGFSSGVEVLSFYGLILHCNLKCPNDRLGTHV